MLFVYAGSITGQPQALQSVPLCLLETLSNFSYCGFSGTQVLISPPVVSQGPNPNLSSCGFSGTQVLISPPVVSQGPKSSFITPEKRAKLRSNPVKVRFAEEVEVNSHSQGNSLLFLPNVLKVYLENGQTKAFKFEPNTTVKDIVMTLKEKLSLSRIEHFSLVLEQKYSISKLLLLHEEERIQQVVQQKEVHDYRCLFRVCFIPREPEHLLQDDPTAFQYLYLQGINDVLQERFAVEMRCNTALRLAALHIQERLASCGQSPRTKLKIITKSWGIENFISSTLLRNMREKDLRKAIGYHMKKSQSQEPKQKVLSANQAKINYLEELCDLKSFGGKSFSATMMLQDRESMVTLLVGSRYGISQVVNHKLSIMTTLTEFSSITRIELLPESDRVSLVKIYLQDIKPITLLLESVAAKELSCLVAGYCRALVDPSLIIFPWTQDAKQHRVSAEEGMLPQTNTNTHTHTHQVSAEEGTIPPHYQAIHNRDRCRGGGRGRGSGNGAWVNTHHSPMTPDSMNSEPVTPVVDPSENLNYAELSLMLEYLPSPPEASDDEDEEEKREEMRRSNEGTGQEEFSLSGRPRSSSSSLMDCVFTFEQRDARHYYNICPNVTPDSTRTRSLTHPHPETEEEEGGGDEEEQGALLTLEPVPILQPPPGFGDSSSDEEFFDARDRFASPEDPTSGTVSRGVSGLLLYCKGETNEGGGGREMFSRLSRKRSKKRRSFMQTDFTSTVSYPGPDQNQDSDESQQLSLDPEPSEQSQNPCPTVSSLSHAEGEASQLESKPILTKSSRSRRQSMETEPDVMESKSVTALVTAASLSITAVRCRVEPDGKESTDRRGDGEEVEGEMEEEGGGEAGPFTCHMFLTEIKEEEGQRGEETGEEGESDREERQLSLISEDPSSVRGSQFSRRPLCLTKDEDQEASFVPQISISHPGVYGRDMGGEQGVAGGEESVTPLSAPPPPTSPLPPFPAPSIPHTKRGERDSKDGNVGSQLKPFTHSDGEKDISCLTQVHRILTISHQDLTSQGKAETDNDEAIVSTNYVTDNTDVATANIAATANIHFVMANTETTVSSDFDLGTANHKDTNSIKSVPANTIANADFATANSEANAIMYSLTTSNDSTGNANLAMTNANSANTNSAMANIPKESPKSPTTGFLLRPCSPGIIGQSLSASTLRGKIQNLPLYLSRSQETLTLSGVGSPNRNPSPETTSNKTEVMVTTETTKDDDVTKVVTVEDLKDSGVALAESDDSEVTLTESEVGEVLVETAGAEITRLTVSEVKEVVEKVVMVYGSSLPPPLAPISLESKPDHPKMIVKLPTCPIATVETAPPMAPAPICLELKPVTELLSPDHEPLSIRSKMAALSSTYPPTIRSDVDELLTLLQGGRMGGKGGRHPRETCATHFSENKRLLHGEARRLMAGCQKVVRVGQTPDEMLFSLSDSFRTLVGMAGMCLWFSGCDRCDRRNAEALAGLADVARTYREFVLAAERASGRRSCHDLSTKLLAKQCTALTASVFCLTQLFRTLTAL
uniref:FERM domain-containing protein n=1 Tax=Salmo trutta TaxID=8032 RepID=A0A674AAW3_SALTR